MPELLVEWPGVMTARGHDRLTALRCTQLTCCLHLLKQVQSLLPGTSACLAGLDQRRKGPDVRA